jgi:hypothetical protein
MVVAIADVASTYARARIDTASFALFRAVAEEDAIGEGKNVGFIALVGNRRIGGSNYGL